MKLEMQAERNNIDLQKQILENETAKMSQQKAEQESVVESLRTQQAEAAESSRVAAADVEARELKLSQMMASIEAAQNRNAQDKANLEAARIRNVQEDLENKAAIERDRLAVQSFLQGATFEAQCQVSNAQQQTFMDAMEAKERFKEASAETYRQIQANFEAQLAAERAPDEEDN